MAAFDGFGAPTRKFLRGLSRNNEKKWFEAHRDDYQEHYVAPALAFAEAIGPKLAKLSPGVVAEPRINGSLFRVNRDVRFSKDKTPYKDHIDLMFWEGGDRKTMRSSFFLRIRHDQVELGAGAHGMEKSMLAAYRDAVRDPAAGKRLEAAVARVERAGFPIQGEHYKKLPRGFEPISEKRDRLLRFAALYCSTAQKHPDAFASKAFLPWCVGIWKKMLPVHRWLVDELG